VKRVFKAVAGLVWVYSYATLGAMMAIAALPGFYLADWAWAPRRAGGRSALDLERPRRPLGDLLLHPGRSSSSASRSCFVLPLCKFIFRWKPHVGEIPIHSFKIWPWYNYNGMLFMFNTIYGRFARLTSLYPVYLRMMGAHIGRDAVVNTHHIYDLDIISIGDRTVIGANASILGHVGEKGRWCANTSRSGTTATVRPVRQHPAGVTMGDNCHVGAMSLVPKGSTLDANAVYGGVPVRKIKDLSPGKIPPRMM